MSEQLFSRLKQVLKMRGLTYADLAALMALSEVTIKRMFSEQDCKLSRLKALCRVLDLDMHQLIEAEEQSPGAATPLAPEVSQALAANRPLLHLFILLINRYDPGQLMNIYNLSRERLYLYLRSLEDLGLIKLQPDLEVQLSVALPVEFFGDPYLTAEIKQLNVDFVSWVFERANQPRHQFETLSRQLSNESSAIIKQDLIELSRKIRKLAQRDALLVPGHKLTGFKFTAAFSPMPFDKLLRIPS